MRQMQMEQTKAASRQLDTAVAASQFTSVESDSYDKKTVRNRLFVTNFSLSRAPSANGLAAVVVRDKPTSGSSSTALCGERPRRNQHPNATLTACATLTGVAQCGHPCRWHKPC